MHKKFYLALHNERLFNDQFYTFRHGLIAYKIHDEYKVRNIPELKSSISDEQATRLANNYYYILSDDKASEVLDATWNEYGKYTASYLRNLTHDNKGPWKKVYNENQKLIAMNDEDIKQYFRDYIVECQ